MDIVNLSQFAPDRGVATSNYFNGRVLAAEDLRADQVARRLQLAQMGRAVGSGVAYGLQVFATTAAPANVTVTAGVAVNRRGKPLALPADIGVALSVTTPSATATAGLFADCQPAQASAAIVSDGVYLLTIGPSTEFQGAVPAVDLSGADTTLSGCGSQSLVEGVAFRLVGLNLDALPGVSAATAQAIKGLIGQDDPATLSLLRNRLAHAFFGTDDWVSWGSRFSPAWAGDSADEPFGLLAALRGGGVLIDCEVPLAVVYWSASGIRFVDRWSVRRVLEPIGRGLGFPIAAGSSASLSRAVFAQFQEQVADLAGQVASTPTLAASDLSALFAYVPPVGVIPATGPNSPGGFATATLFGGRGPASPTVIRLSHLGGLLRKAESLPPAPVAATQVFQVYQIRENLQQTSSGQTDQALAAFAVRDLQAFLEADDVVLTLSEASDNYARVLRTLAILPTVVSTASLPAWTAIFAMLQNLVQFTSAKATAAGSDGMDLDAVFATFRSLLALENSLALMMQLTFDGDAGATVRQQRSAALNQLLQGTLDDGTPGLALALQSSSYPGVIRAQGAVNDLVGGWNPFATTGGIVVGFVGSDKMLTVVPGQTTTLTLSLNSQLFDRATVLLSGSVSLSKVGDWSKAVVLQTTDGNPLGSLDILPQQTINFLARVTAPSGLNDFGDSVLVEVVASLPTQTSQPAINTTSLVVSASPGAEQAYTLSVVRVPPNLPSTVTWQQGIAPFTFQTSFVSTRPPTTVQPCTWTATFTFTNSQRSDWTIVIPGQAGAEAGNSGVFSLTFTVPPPPPAINPNVLNQIQITPLFAPAASDKSCSFTVSVSGTVFDSQNNTNVAVGGDAPGGPFVVVVPKS